MPPPKYRVLVESIAADIRAGRLGAGSRLPTHRELARREQIAVVTATRVYAELESRGLVSRERGRGTFVRDTSLPSGHGVDQRAVPADAIDLSFNSPALPLQTDLLRAGLRDLASSGDLEALLRYQPHAGRGQDRAAIAGHLLRRGLTTHPDRVLVVSGAQHGLAVTVMSTLSAGDAVAVDALTYPGFTALARQLRLDLAPVPVRHDGPDLDALDALCARRPIRAVYTMPTLHNPLGWVLSAAQRERLCAIARRRGALVVEDASYAYLEEDPPPPLASIAPDVTVYVSGLSKSVATGLRVGFVVAPAGLVPALERAVRVTTWNTPVLATALVRRWIEDGTVARLEVLKREDARARQEVARRALGDLPVVGHPASYFLWLPLPADARPDRVAATLARQGIAVATAEPYSADPHPPQALRVALGSTDLSGLESSLTAVRDTVVDDSRW